ncbi:HpcH/HpaI aldolase family protein [Ectopseudomonas mendocina]|uniref:HpcH/HpaI aldolase family protein n=1 Tax=Ectopseudomonas mendocina TaxID=300 RepID=UPI0005A5E8AA|nr:aldolase/citrate lyase family protein [Pseudomonas mendocina]MDF2075551.1 aldolase/citrate lyase family protein [Pseudomonas mendocina]QTN44139.1 2,4-dihydroxyhept-2-ene-1,7-dioic acid aldolase [Pseudomonas mendocina]VEE14270.1 putative 2,4-dihydroxyhept-2-ene-1,7-dioic acid aldolase [Pseudomonas mendocina]
MNDTLKQRMARGTTYGMNIYGTASMPIEVAGNWGLDFVFIDAEHTSLGIDRDMEKLILAAKCSNIHSLVRVRGTLDWDIRKALEMGASGVIIPQVHTAEQMRSIIRCSKFPPMGRRGGDSSVRSASYAGPNFDWSTYIQAENERTVIVPMAESYEFFDNIDAILDVEGIDAVHFGPADYSLSRQLPVDYRLGNPEVLSRLQLLIEKCHARGIQVMVPCFPADDETARRLIEMGSDMLLMGSDLSWLNQAGQRISAIRREIGQ